MKVSGVARNSPAKRAGLKKDDIIISIEEQRTRSTADVQAIINNIDITEDKSLSLSIYRDGEIKNIKLELVRSKDEI